MKKMMIFAVLLSLVFVGCSKSAPADEPAGAASTATTKSGLVAPPGYPSGPITLIIPQNAGGATDLGARLIAKYLQDYLSTPVVPVNMPGGNAAIGLLEMLKKPADGHTIAKIFTAAYTSSLTTGQFDMKTDFDYICQQVSDPRILSFNPNDKRFSSREELFQFARTNPGVLTMCATNLHTDQYFQAITLSQTTDLKTEVVAFDGFAPAKTAFLGGFLDILFVSLAETTPMLLENQVVPMMVLMENRIDELPDLPTARELGIDMVSASNRGYAFKSGTDRAIRDYIEKTFELVTKDPAYLEEMAGIGLRSAYLPGKEFAALVSDAVDLMAPMMREIGLIK